MRYAALLLIAMISLVASASHHNWRVVEVYSNADGTLQFIEMASTNANETNLSCCLFTSSNTQSGASVSYAFPSDLSEDSLNRTLLLGTSGIEAAFGIRPDYIIPDNYLFRANGGIQYNEPVLWTELPANGIDSINVSAGQQQIAPATPTNFDGDTVTLPVDKEAPVITVPGALTIASNAAVPADDERVTDFVASVTCVDAIDPDPTLNVVLPPSLSIGRNENAVTCVDNADNLAQATLIITVEAFDDADGDGIANGDDPDDDNDGTPDVSDAFPLDASETTDTDGDGIGNNADTDDDGDGTPDNDDAFPLDASESVDTDGDGIGNNADTDDDGDGTPDAEEDSVAPVITGAADITIDATGRLTSVDLSAVSATDDKDGVVPVSSDKTGPFRSGRHVVTWTAVDSAGNRASTEQILDIRPIVMITARQTVTEGESAAIAIALSGEAPDYPVTIDTDVTGSATSGDFAAALSPITISSGTSALIAVDIVDDDIVEQDETLIVTLLNSAGAVIRPDTTHVMTITEANIAPRGSLTVSQSGEPRATVYSDDGAVMVTADVVDPDSTTLTFDWSASSPELLMAESTSPAISFDAAMLAPGSYVAEVTIADGIDSLTLRRGLVVLASKPTLTGADSDDDGISDVDEGLADSDGDAIPDYLDADDNPRFLPTATGAVIETGAGLQLRLGELAVAAGNTNASITTDLAPIDVGYRFTGTLKDFEIRGLAAGAERVWVVVPLEAPIPAGAVYRKYSAAGGWTTMTIDGDNSIASAAPRDGICPPPADDIWQAGLTAGHQCLRLWLTDGGPNDADGRRNGEILDPSGVAVVDPAPSLTVPAPLTLEATSLDGAAKSAASEFLAAATCTDEFDGTIQVDVQTLDPFPIGESAVLFSCSDSASNVVSESVTVTVIDSTPPTITLGSPLRITSAAAISPSDSRVTAFIDSVSCSDTVTATPELSSVVPASLAIGTNPVSFECTDDAGNAATIESTITVAVPASQVEQSDEGAGCFIATAAYGSPLDPHVDALRKFRDAALIWHRPGQQLVQFYYAHSPAAARVIEQAGTLRWLTQAMLTPVVFSIVFPAQATIILLLLLGWARIRRLRRAAT